MTEIETLTEEIRSYLIYLREIGLQITLHGNLMERYQSSFAMFNIHENPYCLLIKSSSSAWDACIACQKRVGERLAHGPFFGTCYAGVSEFVYPVSDGEMLLGFVSVSGYRAHSAFTGFQWLSEQFGLNASRLQKSYFENLRTELPDRAQLDRLLAPLCRMLQLLIRLMPADTPQESGDTGIYGEVLAYLLRHYAEPVRLSDIAIACKCSPSHISHLFKQKSGQTLPAYLNAIRVKNAKQLLRNTDMRIQEIAFTVGFSDSNYFTNVFRKVTGLSPRAFRARQKA